MDPSSLGSEDSNAGSVKSADPVEESAKSESMETSAGPDNASGEEPVTAPASRAEEPVAEPKSANEEQASPSSTNSGSGSTVRPDVAQTKTDDAKDPPNDNGNLLEWVKAIGTPLITLLISLILGFYLNARLKEHESAENARIKEHETRVSKENLYAQLLIQREQSDALVRKDMFGVVINRFLAEPKHEDLETKVLQLELLANNFSQSLDLTPLFKDLAHRLMSTTSLKDENNKQLLSRIDKTSLSLISKQVIGLARRGFQKRKQFTFHVQKWSEKSRVLFNESISLSSLLPLDESTKALTTPVKEETINIVAELMDFRAEQREMTVRVQVYFTHDDQNFVDRHFDVGIYNFPMLDNIQLPRGLRLALVMTTYEPSIDEVYTDLHLTVFPASAASFKERQDYDDVLLDMLRSAARTAKR